MFSRRKISKPTASPIRQQSNSENPIPRSGSHRRKPMKKTAPTSAIELKTVTTMS
jgi:hypothetical protein